METYQNFIGLKSIFYFCSLPLRLDSYRGCSHGCIYCFSRNLNNRNYKFSSRIIPADPKQFERLMRSVLESNHNFNSPVRSCLERRIPLHFGCVSDPFQPVELKYRVTLEFLKIIREFNYPCVISTKSDLITDPKYIEMITGIPVSIQISFSTLNDELANLIEPYSPPPSKRLLVLKQLAQNRLYTVGRLQPFLFPREKLLPETFEKLASVGVKHIVLEHLRIPTNSSMRTREELWHGLGMNMLDKYKKMGMKYSRVNYELNSEQKLNNVLKAKELANKYGMSFGSGDNDFHHISDNLCCCGIPGEGFQNIYDGHFGYGAFLGRASGRISYEYINKTWQPKGSIKEYINSDCRVNGQKSVTEFLMNKLNRPESSNSPLCFYGLEWLGGIEYRYNDKFLDIMNIGVIDNEKSH